MAAVIATAEMMAITVAGFLELPNFRPELPNFRLELPNFRPELSNSRAVFRS